MAAIELSPGANENGLAVMMATMVCQNLEDHPERRLVFEKLDGRVAIVAEDADVALTMHFSRGRLRLYDGIVGIPDLTIRSGSEVIADLSRMETGRFGLPDPAGEVNRTMALAIREGRLQIFGLPGGFPLLARLGTVLSVS